MKELNWCVICDTSGNVVTERYEYLDSANYGDTVVLGKHIRVAYIVACSDNSTVVLIKM